MRKSRFFIAATALVVALGAGLAVGSRSDTAEAAVVWNEDFNGPAGSGVDQSKWNFDVGGHGWGNEELQYYTNGTSNVAMNGQGQLVITARKGSGGNNCWNGACQFTSGRIQTSGKFTQQYGHIEARIQVPNGSGLWPAFWMLGGGNWPADGEIDIMEVVGREPNQLFGTLHGPGYSGGNAYGQLITSGTPWHQAFHTYAVDWSPNLIVWTVDGREFFRATPDSLRAAKGNVNWVFNHGFFIILNLAVGGNFGQGNPAGLPAESKMLIDYVHVSTSTTTPPPTGGGNALKSSLSGRCIDIPGANPADGSRLQTYDCNGTAAQQWTANGDGTMRAMGKCMDPAGGALANGTPIQLVTCNGNPVQRFTLSGAGDLVNVSANKCVDVKDRNTANGAQLQLWDCSGEPNQKWTRA
ncbi:glycoside hydrolase family 16 protein [Paractinoplanes brasiliensis]|uniref:Beta-glucanase (GH16 family) n=1 Tax=Paractinoplanes brasiliensis TaxID=52695 RepID=A0A4R6JMF9_9ACTN|nr:glycoside hydrolase family 16 protein [Actinoplanes brasiliensis]TDO37329.1 beta-glucanase (GH16 family) [Actinoplanes brasiliensis]GID29356.1 endo-1,3-beta-glucanase [Actinoplanes brasiliensis]